MQIVLYLTDFIVPLVIFGIIGYGLLMKIPVYDTLILSNIQINVQEEVFSEQEIENIKSCL